MGLRPEPSGCGTSFKKYNPRNDVRVCCFISAFLLPSSRSKNQTMGFSVYILFPKNLGSFISVLPTMQYIKGKNYFQQKGMPRT